MKVSRGGPIRVNKNCPIYEYKKTKVIIVDLNTKRAAVITGSNPGDIPFIALMIAEDTVYENKKAKKLSTEITFPEYKGWSILQAEVCKYCLAITFVKCIPTTRRIR